MGNTHPSSICVLSVLALARGIPTPPGFHRGIPHQGPLHLGLSSRGTATCTSPPVLPQGLPSTSSPLEPRAAVCRSGLIVDCKPQLLPSTSSSPERRAAVRRNGLAIDNKPQLLLLTSSSPGCPSSPEHRAAAVLRSLCPSGLQDLVLIYIWHVDRPENRSGCWHQSGMYRTAGWAPPTHLEARGDHDATTPRSYTGAYPNGPDCGTCCGSWKY